MIDLRFWCLASFSISVIFWLLNIMDWLPGWMKSSTHRQWCSWNCWLCPILILFNNYSKWYKVFFQWSRAVSTIWGMSRFTATPKCFHPIYFFTKTVKVGLNFVKVSPILYKYVIIPVITTLIYLVLKQEQALK